MPTFRTAPSSSLTSAVRRLVASGGANLSPLQQIQADQAAAETAHKLSLVDKVRAEVEAEREKAAAVRRLEERRRDPAARTEYAGIASGLDLPDATRLAGAIRGDMEQPGPADIDDAAMVGREAQPYRMARPNIQPGQERLFRAALASVHGLDFATGNTNAEQLANAAGEHQQNALVEAVQQAIGRGDMQTASAVSQGAKPGTAIKLHENIGNTGATFAPATGAVASDPKAQPGNTLLARSVANIAADEARARAAATASTAAAEASRAHAGLYTAQADSERAERGRGGKPPAGYRWKADGSLEKIPGGPADDKATSTDAERISAGYASRMLSSARILADLEIEGIGKPELDETALRAAGAKDVANAAMSPKRQKYRQAQEDWVRAKLRKESGAVIADEEMDREIRTYFPQLGDKKEVIAQKADARRVAEQSMVQAAGRAQVQQPKAPGTPAGEVQARKKIGNVEFVKINGQWYQP